MDKHEITPSVNKGFKYVTVWDSNLNAQSRRISVIAVFKVEGVQTEQKTEESCGVMQYDNVIRYSQI